MCQIEEVPSFRLDDKLYPTRQEAVKAGLLNIASDIQRNHVNAILPGLLVHRDALIYLLEMHAEDNPLSLSRAGKDPGNWKAPGRAPLRLARSPSGMGQQGD